MKYCWSEEEIKILKENYLKLTDRELAILLNKKVYTISQKRYKLGLRKISLGYFEKFRMPAIKLNEHIKRDSLGRFIKLEMPPKTYLEELYLQKKFKPSRIGQILKVSSNTVRRWLNQYKIPIRRPFLSYVNINLSETEKAYLAGYLDGDGTITANYSKNEKYLKGYGIHFDVSLISINFEFISKLKDIIGGKIRTFIYHDSRYKKEGYKLCFGNQISVLSFLKSISPYLILKQRQAKLLIKFLENRIEARKFKGNSAKISDESYKLIEKIRELNKK